MKIGINALRMPPKCIHVLVLIGVLLLVGCGNRMPAASDLAYYARGLPTMSAVLEKFDLAHIGSGVGKDGVYLEVRRRHDPAVKPTEAEIEKIKQAIYKEYDRKFPLHVTFWTMPEIPTLEGRITAMDHDRILVVGALKENDGSPKAMWLQVGPDSVIRAPTGEALTIDRLKIGYQVRAWSDALVATSYPEQSGLLRMEETNIEVGDGDLQGVITKKGTAAEDMSQHELQIDGKAYRVSTTASVRVDNHEAGFEDLKEGDRVQVWFAGYEVMPGDKVITQIVVTPNNERH